MKYLAVKPFLKKTLFACLIFQSTLVIAAERNQCGDFHIQITNLTTEACILTDQAVRHGNLITPAPSSILPQDSKRFDMSQAVYGPNVILSYQCGQDSITFSSKQNLCFLEAGNIQGVIMNPLSTHITARYTAISGSYFWEKSGSINWVITTL